MKSLQWLLLPAILTTIFCGGCGGPKSSASAPARKTVSEIDTKIQEAQANPNIPPQVKPRVVAALQKEREEAAKAQATNK